MTRDEIIIDNGFIPDKIRIEPTYKTSREPKRYTGVLVVDLNTGLQASSVESENESENLIAALQSLRQKLDVLPRR